MTAKSIDKSRLEHTMGTQVTLEGIVHIFGTGFVRLDRGLGNELVKQIVGPEGSLT